MITKLSDYYQLELSDIEKMFLPLHILCVAPILALKWYKEIMKS